MSGDPITVEVGSVNGGPPLLTTLVTVLADPFGLVFDSETGTPVSGATVRFLDNATGQPATVFADDGVTPWPSTVISGEPITDAAGNVNIMRAGEYRFPLAPLGTYRIEVTPPAPYTAPSEVPPPRLADLTRPSGAPFTIFDASYGAPFALSSTEAIRIDIPVDRPNVSVALTKTASRVRAEPGDAVFYTIVVKNADAERSKRDVTVIDTPSPWLRLRTDTITLDGQPLTSGFTVAEDGSSIRFEIDTIAAGATLSLQYAMVIRANTPPGQIVNRVEATDPRDGNAVAESIVTVVRDTIASRMTIIGRVTAGTCDLRENRIGIPGVRIMLEDGSFVLTDRDGRYHFEGVVPGTHVVQAQQQTLPVEGEFIDCDRSTRTAGSAISRFVIGRGGSLKVADFTANVPGWAPAPAPTPAPVDAVDAEDAVAPAADVRAPAESAATTRPGNAADAAPVGDKEAAGVNIDWLAKGPGETAFLFPLENHNPRVPSQRVAIRHAPGQTVELALNGEAVNAVAFDGAKKADAGTHAVSTWRGLPLQDGDNRITATVRNADGSVAKEMSRVVAYVSTPWRAELIAGKSNMVADGRNRPVIAVRFTDRKGRPVRSGVSGSFGLNEPYTSAALIEQLQRQQLAGQGTASADWTIKGDDGIAYIELAPTMISGPLTLDFTFAGREISRSQQLESWIVPGDLDWTLVGLAEGSIGALSVADNMERTGRFDSDLGENARVAFYAKGRVLGRFLMTVAYDSAKQRDDQILSGAIDPNAYYTVFADGSDRRFDAASRENLYVRIETGAFYALYGDFVSGFDQTVLARYNRSATGVKAEGRVGAFHAQAFAADVASRFRRDEIQGNGLSGPYALSDRNIIANSEKVAIEVRDRFRSELIVDRRELSRFIDYDVDLLTGTLRFKEPVLSRDFDLNPQFIVVDYEVEDGFGDASWNGGVRADYTFAKDTVRVGASLLTDKDDTRRTDIAAVDVRAKLGAATEIRAELGVSRAEGSTAKGWLVEAEHRTGPVDLLAYVRSLDADYGTGQQNGAELGRRKVGLDARYAVNENISVTGSAWYDESLVDDSRRQAVQLGADFRSGATQARLGVTYFDDRLADLTGASSLLGEASVTQALFDGKLELSAATSIALDKAELIDAPARHRLRARYALTDWLRLVGSYEIAEGEELSARTFNGGVEVSPWGGARATATLGQQDIDEFGPRSYAAFGLNQTLRVSKSLTLDATVDGNRTLSGADPAKVINIDQPVASGGQFGADGALFEDFTAVTLGASWRKDAWAATVRGEYRDGEDAERMGVVAGLIRQLGDGFVVGSGATWTRATGATGSLSEIFDGAVSVAYRPDESTFAALGKLEFRSDAVRNAIAGEPGATGRTALNVTGDAKSERVVASLSTNWSPRGSLSEDDETGKEGDLLRRTEVGVFVGGRYNLDSIGDFDLASTTVMGGLDLRVGIGSNIEVGGTATVRANLDDGTTSYAFGPQIGFTPAKNTLLTVGYNIAGFRDPDFTETRNTDEGLYASIRMKFDADTFSFLGLGRR